MNVCFMFTCARCYSTKLICTTQNVPTDIFMHAHSNLTLNRNFYSYEKGRMLSLVLFSFSLFYWFVYFTFFGVTCCYFVSSTIYFCTYYYCSFFSFFSSFRSSLFRFNNNFALWLFLCISLDRVSACVCVCGALGAIILCSFSNPLLKYAIN